MTNDCPQRRWWQHWLENLGGKMPTRGEKLTLGSGKRQRHLNTPEMTYDQWFLVLVTILPLKSHECELFMSFAVRTNSQQVIGELSLTQSHDDFWTKRLDSFSFLHRVLEWHKFGSALHTHGSCTTKFTSYWRHVTIHGTEESSYRCTSQSWFGKTTCAILLVFVMNAHDTLPSFPGNIKGKLNWRLSSSHPTFSTLNILSNTRSYVYSTWPVLSQSIPPYRN